MGGGEEAGEGGGAREGEGGDAAGGDGFGGDEGVEVAIEEVVKDAGEHELNGGVVLEKGDADGAGAAEGGGVAVEVLDAEVLTAESRLTALNAASGEGAAAADGVVVGVMGVEDGGVAHGGAGFGGGGFGSAGFGGGGWRVGGPGWVEGVGHGGGCSLRRAGGAMDRRGGEGRRDTVKKEGPPSR